MHTVSFGDVKGAGYVDERCGSWNATEEVEMRMASKVGGSAVARSGIQFIGSNCGDWA